MINCLHRWLQYIRLSLCLVLSSGATLHAQTTGYAWLEFSTQDTVFASAGDPVYFDVVVRDAKGDTIKNWNSVGQPIELHVTNSDAGLDTSIVSWSARSDAYTWLMITRDGTELSRPGPQQFSIGEDEFTDGVVHLTFLSSKAEVGTRIEALPFIDSVISRSPPITRIPLAADNFLVDWTPQQQGEAASTFFVKRPMELFVTPRDRFTNPAITALDMSVLVNFSHEFSPVPGYPFLLSAMPRSIHSEQAFYFMPDTTRVRGQSGGYVITAYCSTNFSITGKCDPFWVAPHEPLPFFLLSPGDETELTIDRWDDTVIFRWEQPVPPDPYSNLHVSRDDPRTYSDTVRYYIHFAAADSLENEVILEADAGGTAATFTCTEEVLAAIADTLSGTPDMPRFEMIYFVEATDGLTFTRSTPVDTTLRGNRLTVVNAFADIGVALQFPGNEAIERIAGEAVSFALVALDKNDAVVPDWNVDGRTTILRVQQSVVESDTSIRSWSDDPDGYSWARLEVEGTIIPSSAPGEYHIPKTLFVSGRASATYASSKAEAQVRLEVSPRNTRLNQISPPIRWRAAAFDNILADITWPHPEMRAVYLERPFELYVAARDRFLNPLEEETSLRLELRFPGEIVLAGDSTRPPLDTILQLSGETTVLLLSTAPRSDSTVETTMQKVSLHALADATVRDDVGSFRVLEHAPLPFGLLAPIDRTAFRLESWYSEEVFSWEQPAPPDRFSEIVVSRYSNAESSDTLRYTLRLRREDGSQTELAFLSDEDGHAAKRTFTSNELHAMYQHFAGLDTSGMVDLLWYVDATDGLFTTRSNPVDSTLVGYRLGLTYRKPAEVVLMDIPFAANTTARFTIDNGEDFRGTETQLSVTGSVDTLGYPWWKVVTSGAQTPIQALYRNDYDGLHIARESSGKLFDRLWLPAHCVVGDSFPMGHVLATDSMDCGGVMRATVTIDYGGFGVWTWADSLGLISVAQGSSVFRIAEIGELLHPLEPMHAQELTVPFAPDDLLVYRMAGGASPDWRYNIFRSREKGFSAWAQNYPSLRCYLVFEGIIDLEYGVYFLVNDRGMLTEYDSSQKDSVELYPAFIPTESTILLNNVAWSVGRRFDTIVIGARCRAFELRRGDFYRVITDRFGEVFCSSAKQICLLSSAVVRDTAYNRASPAVRWFDLCVGNRYQYRYSNGRRTMKWTDITADTLVDGERWYLFSGDGPLTGWYRSDSSGFYRRDMTSGGIEPLFSGSMNIGDLCRWGMVSDTTSVNVDGIMRRRLDSYEPDFGYMSGWHVRLLEGIGMQDLEMHGWESSKDYELVYADVCGLQWGAILGIGEAPVTLPAQPTLTISPQPLRGQGIAYIVLPRPARVRITVHDMLGRERFLVGEGEIPAGTSTFALSTTELDPGLYFICLHGDAVTVVRRFLVLR
ncbi:MAG: T9SS type A sorting domain-containing protein [Bacteroidota bacterium]